MKKAFLLACLLFPLSTFAQSAWRTKVAPEVLAVNDSGQKTDLLISFKQQANLQKVQKIRGKSAK
ncbi:MAG: hypothetical protein JNJ57_14230, partial [Saprospiraceae bacterium]|nr:hypothetical protein [Saprospiraceae bacterium]